MKNLFLVKLVCPFCKKEIEYNIISFKAKHECKHCENDLLVRTRLVSSSIISFIGFFIVLGLMNILGITELGALPRVLFIIVGCLSYLGIAYALYCKLFGANKLFAVDAQDPTLLKHYKKKK